MITHQIVLMLLIGYVVYTVDLRKKYFPVPVVLVVLGIGLSFIPYFSSLHISKEIIFNVFLPGILFTSAYQFPLKRFKEDFGLIAALSTGGLIVSAFLLGSGVYYAAQWMGSPLSWAGALLLAAILIPTDPVSVTAILKQSSGSGRLSGVVEGESMINDGTSIVIFTIFLSMLQTGEGFSVGTFASEFLLVSVKGVGTGLLLGWLLSRVVRFNDNKAYRVMVTLAAAYGGFYVSEAIGGSGVLATVASGMMLAYEIGHTEGEGGLKGHLDGFWDIVKPSLLAVLFLWIGLDGAGYLGFPGWGLAAVVFMLSLLVRLVMITASMYSVPAWRRKFGHAGRASLLITWSGIKGTMSVALLLWTQEAVSGPDARLVPLAFAAIFLSLLLQSTGVYPLTRLLNRDK
ncbi:cation:proton antiporter [Saccharibacillus alkalitolerans]|uniref:cation:proton antiporter n=1 Tax=Saccharibacillus alkalitolerans TaxID=2705290 RepID=UPI001F4900F3|nr:cation:proton antiporter [Saccharibacillus alkalitolerans]